MLESATRTPYRFFDAATLQQEIVESLAHGQGHIVWQHKLHAQGIGHALAYQAPRDIAEGRPLPGDSRATTVEYNQEDVGGDQGIGEAGSLNQIGPAMRFLK